MFERLRVHQNNLEVLLLQEARHGIDVPLSLTNEIKHQQESVRSIEDEIADVDRLIAELLQQGEKTVIEATGTVRMTVSINGAPYTVDAPYPFLSMTSVGLPDRQIQSTIQFAGGFEVRSVLKPETKALEIEFFRHGRRVSPDLDHTRRRLIVPTGLSVEVPTVEASTTEQESLESIPPERVAGGRWTLIPPAPPQRTVIYTEYPQGQKGYITTTRFQYGRNCEVWLVQPPGRGDVRLWFYIGDWNITPAMDHVHLALSFPEEVVERFLRLPYSKEPSGEPEPLLARDLRKVLVERFDLEELRTLCSDLGVDFDDLRGEGKQAKARELVGWLDRRGLLDRLVEYIKQSRPDIELA
ncbi:MAG: hypothetical protein ACUVX8_18930 [Candidatus Zipacnadales bacterium]